MAFLGFAVSAAYWPGLLSGVFVPRWAAIAVGVPLLASLDPRALPEHLRYILLFLIAVAAMSVFLSPDPLAGWLEFFFIVMLSAAFVMGAGLDNLDDIMLGLAIGLVPSSILCATQYYGWWSPVPQSTAPAGLFFNSEVLAEFAALIAVWALLCRRWAFVLVAAVPLALCGSRVALLAVAIAVLYALRPRSRWLTAGLVLTIVAAGIGLLFAFGIGKMFSADQRIILWGATALALTPFGNGLGWFQAAHPVEMYAHSDALQALAELGVGGLMLLAIPITIFRNRRGTHAERAVFVAACVEIALSFPLHLPASGFTAAVVAGYLAGRGLPVCVGGADRRTADGRGVQRRENAGRSTDVDGGLCGDPLPVRSLSAFGAGLRPGQHRLDPATARESGLI